MPKLRVIIKPPPEPMGDAEQQTEALRDYLLQMSEELAYVLTHLEADNINDSTFEKIQGMIPRPYTGLPVMDGDTSAGQSEQWARGDHRHGHDSTKADVTALEETAEDLAAHIADKGNPHEVTKAQVGLDQVANERQYSAQNPPPIPTPVEVGAIPATEKGSAGGVAELDSNGMVPSAQLPSYVDDVLEYPTLADFPVTGESGKIYVALDTGRTYRWGGSAYVEISESLVLGETSSTAYRGDRGKIAYDHSQTSGNPHGTTAAEVGARPDNWTPTAADVGARPDNWVPTKADVGLGNVENERQYSAQNPPPYPVTSVNGSTGAVSLDAADVGARPDDWVPDAEDVPYDNTQSGLMATDVQAAIDEIAQGGGGGGTAASAVSYDNTDSGLAATNVQDAIDEVYDEIPSVPSAYTSNPAMDSTASPGSSGEWAKGDHVHPSDTSRVPVYGLGKNLLDNAYFIGGGSQLGDGVFPINQRGQASYSTDGYALDRWWFNPYSYGTLTLTSAGLQIAKNGATSGPGIRQDMEHDLDGQIVTFSALDNAGNLYTFTSGTLDNTVSGWQSSHNFDVMWVGIRYISGKWSVSITTPGITLAALKLEFGTQSTLTHTESGTTVIAVLPDFWAEYANAQRYLKVVNAWRDLYAARVDNSNLSFFIPGHMVKTPATLSSQQIYYYSASSGNITGNISFVSVPNGVYGYVSRGSLSANTGGSVVFPAAVYISAE